MVVTLHARKTCAVYKCVFGVIVKEGKFLEYWWLSLQTIIFYLHGIILFSSVPGWQKFGLAFVGLVENVLESFNMFLTF